MSLAMAAPALAGAGDPRALQSAPAQSDAQPDAEPAKDADGEPAPPKPLEQVTLNLTFTEAAGPFVQWETLSRHAMVVTFIYTRDRQAARSQWALRELAAMQKRLEHSDLAEGVYLVALTVDPRYDQAHRLKKSAEAHGLIWPTARLLQSKYDDLPAVAGAFGLAYEQVDVETIAFEPAFVVLAPGGKVLYEARGQAAWKPAEAIEKLQDLRSRRGEQIQEEAESQAHLPTVSRPATQDVQAVLED